MPKTTDTALPDAIKSYLDHLAESPRTRQTYQTGLRVFMEFTRSLDQPTHLARSPSQPEPSKASHRSIRGGRGGTLALQDINSDVLQSFQAWLGKRSYSRFSQRTYLASLAGFLSFALSKDWLPDSFSLEKARAKLRQVSRRSSYPIPRPDPALPRVISYYDRLPLAEGDGPKDRRQRLNTLRSRAFVHLLYSSAGRLAEVASLDRKAVADGRRSEAIVTGKGDKQRFIFITADARAAISAYIHERHDSFEPLFISHGRNYGRRFSRVSLWRVVKHAGRTLGLDVSPHDFRHFRASQMLEQGAPLEAIQEILGHSDISTTRRVYAHYSRPAIRAIFDRTTLTPRQASRGHRDEGNGPTE